MFEVGQRASHGRTRLAAHKRRVGNVPHVYFKETLQPSPWLTPIQVTSVTEVTAYAVPAVLSWHVRCRHGSRIHAETRTSATPVLKETPAAGESSLSLICRFE